MNTEQAYETKRIDHLGIVGRALYLMPQYMANKLVDLID